MTQLVKEMVYYELNKGWNFLGFFSCEKFFQVYTSLRLLQNKHPLGVLQSIDQKLYHLQIAKTKLFILVTSVVVLRQ